MWEFYVKVKPNAKQESIEIISDMFGFSHLAIKVSVPPEDNKANKAVTQLLSDYFKIAKSLVVIKKGHTQRNKLISVKADESKIQEMQMKINYNKKAS